MKRKVSMKREILFINIDIRMNGHGIAFLELVIILIRKESQILLMFTNVFILIGNHKINFI